MAEGREWTCSLCDQVFFGRRFECPCRSKVEGREATLICNNCGEPVECKDDGRFWHVEGYVNYDQCRLYAEPVKEYR